MEAKVIPDIIQLDAQGQPIDDAEAALEAERLARVEAEAAAFLGRCYFLDMSAADAKRLGEAA